MPFQSVDPSNGHTLEEHAFASGKAIEEALSRATASFPGWRAAGFERRAEILRAMAALLRRDARDHARTISLEMGKPRAQAEAEVLKCATACAYFAEHSGAWLAPDARSVAGARAYVTPAALGPILAIMPWNFPYWQVFRFAAPALAAGNVAIVKHAPNVPACALSIERVAREAGAPEGVVHNLFLSVDDVPDVVADPRVRGVTLTGSTAAGSAVAALAGAALKPVVLELGGSDPFIVFADADLDRCARLAVEARCQNTGQSCIAAKRFLVETSVYPEFLDAFVARMEALEHGAPLETDAPLGPLAREDLRTRLDRQVRDSVASGARAALEGGPVDGPGWFYRPGVLVDVPENAPAAREELFGPVATVEPFTDAGDAVARANGTRFGLGASVWTGDLERAAAIADALDCGGVFVNGIVRSDPKLPFGGVRDSGFGRELAREGVLAFTSAKTHWIAGSG